VLAHLLDVPDFYRGISMTARTIRLRASLLVGIVSLVLGGCGGVTENVAPTYNVSGKVNVDGAPLESGRIFFESADPTLGISNYAEIKNGSFSGKAASGDMKVKVMKTETIKDPMGVSDTVKETPLKSDISMTLKAGDNTLPTIEIDTTQKN